MNKILLLMHLVFTINAFAQCNASFTYTTTSSSISVTSTSTGTTSSTGYSWYLSNGESSGDYSSNSSYTFASLYNGTYTVALLLDSTACTDTSGSIQTITIGGGANEPICNASFTYTVGSSGIVDFTNTSPVDSLSNNVYTWALGNSGITSNSENATHTYYYNGNYTVTLKIYNAISGCLTSSSQTLSISNANPTPICTSNFTYTVGTSGLVNFTALYRSQDFFNGWNFGDGNYHNNYNLIDSSGIVPYTYQYNGTYSVTVTIIDSLANCFSTTTQTISVINAGCVPNVNFYLHQDTLNPQPGIWEVSTYYSPQVVGAIWSWGDGISTIGFSPTHTYTAAGQYNICVTAYAACGDSSYVCQNDNLYRGANGANSIISVSVLNVNNVTGIKNLNEETAQISVYPNPGTGLFTLNLTNASAAKAQISITNILGELVYSTQESISNNALAKEINLQNAANGTYFIKVVLGDKAYTNKIVINK